MNDFMEKYLGEVDRRLRRLPVAERVDIVNELKSEIAELVSGGMTPEQIVARLGSAKELAGGYLGDAIARSQAGAGRRVLQLCGPWRDYHPAGHQHLRCGLPALRRGLPDNRRGEPGLRAHRRRPALGHVPGRRLDGRTVARLRARLRRRNRPHLSRAALLEGHRGLHQVGQRCKKKAGGVKFTPPARTGPQPSLRARRISSAPA